MNAYNELIKGLWRENPIFRMLLGMCPTLAVTTSVPNGLGMGLASTFVLVCANTVIAAVRNLIPAKVRIPCFIMIIAGFVTLVDLVLEAYAYTLHGELGIFIPLIVVNCMILGRAEAFASKHAIGISIIDGLGMGAGFTFGLVALSAFREIIGNGSLAGIPLGMEQPWLMLILPPGGFLALGLLLGLMNHIDRVIARRAKIDYPTPPEFDCRHCVICRWGGEETAPSN